MRTPRDSVSVVDIDWYSSEVPLLLFSNGTMRMMDINLKRSCSPMSEQDLTGLKNFKILLSGYPIAVISVHTYVRCSRRLRMYKALLKTQLTCTNYF